MKNKKNIFNINGLLFLCLIASLFSACDDNNDEVFVKTRLFRPVLNEPLEAQENSIIVHMASLTDAVGYTVEVSRDEFATTEYTVESDNNYVVIDENTVGEELEWDTLYQIRGTAKASDPEYNSKVSDLGSVRTETPPSF